ncbi:MAG: peptidylprolyl isomerase [Ignavibacteriales bacterium]
MSLARYRRTFLLILFIQIISFQAIYSQVVAKFGKYEISLDEFEHAYAKNVGGWDIASQQDDAEYKKFLDLYVNFKMKLRDAQVRAYDKDPELINELKDYQEQVGVSYILEKWIIEPGVRQLYDRRTEEYRVSHIMIRPDTLGEEGARMRAQEILDSIKNGASFEIMAEKYSDDKFSSVSGGDIYFITAGLLPYEFEDPMYTLNAGQVFNEVVKTKFGYHLIKATVRQHRYPKIKASHILIGFHNSDGQIDTIAAEKKADSVYAQLQAGASFDELVVIFSDDPSSKEKGGDLGYFERRMMVKEFDEVAFSMEVGQISKPVKTNFGYHIILLTDKMDTQPYDAEYENLKTMFNKQRYQHELETLIDSLKQKYDFKIDETALNKFIDESDSLRFGMVHPKYDEIFDETLFSYADVNITIGKFLELTSGNSKVTAKPMDDKTEVTNAINILAEDMLLKEEARNLDKTDPEFAQLMNDYRDGIFIFKLQEEEVWSRVKIDSADVYNYWNENKEKYSWPDRISFSEIYTTKDSLIQVYYDMLEGGTPFDTLAGMYTERSAKKKEYGFYGLQTVDLNDSYKEANKIPEVGQYTVPFSFSGGFVIFKLEERQAARLKTFEEAKAEVSGEYQEMLSKKLESDYIQSLDSRYKPEIFYNELQYAFEIDKNN